MRDLLQVRPYTGIYYMRGPAHWRHKNKYNFIIVLNISQIWQSVYMIYYMPYQNTNQIMHGLDLIHLCAVSIEHAM